MKPTRSTDDDQAGAVEYEIIPWLDCRRPMAERELSDAYLNQMAPRLALVDVRKFVKWRIQLRY